MRPAYETASVVAAIACVPAGFLLPLTVGLKGLEVRGLAIGIWTAGALIALAVPKAGSWRSERLVALWTNWILAALAILGYCLTRGLTAH